MSTLLKSGLVLSSIRIASRTLILLSFCLMLPIAAAADTIVLKNGRTIEADSTRRVNGRVEYTIGESTFAIRESLVERIDTGARDFVTAPKQDIPRPATAEPRELRDVSSQVIVNQAVDTEALARFEAGQDKSAAAAADWAAASFEHSRGNIPAALRYVQRAVSFAPRNVFLLDNESAMLIEMAEYRRGAEVAEQATRLPGATGHPYALLGYALLQQGRNAQAVKALEQACKMSPDDESFRQLLAKAQRDDASQAGYSEEGSEHFTLHFEGKTLDRELRKAILDTLESEFREIRDALNFTPQDSTAVIVYTDRSFFDASQVPSWASAFNDGKLRISAQGMTGMTPQLARVLKHELAHSFIAGITHQRCPAWLNEGIAQWLEPRGVGANGRRLAELYAGQHQIPLNQLESPFVEFSGAEAGLAYAESLEAAQYLAATYGSESLAEILQRIGSGMAPEAALRAVTHSGYDGLETDLAKHLRQAYGG